MFRKTLIIAAFAAISTPVLADDFAVSWEPWELSTNTYRAELLDRIDRQARQFCEVNARPTSLAMRAEAEACREALVEATVGQIGDVRLTQLHETGEGEPVRQVSSGE